MYVTFFPARCCTHSWTRGVLDGGDVERLSPLLPAPPCIPAPVPPVELTPEPFADARVKSSCQPSDRSGVPVSGSIAAASSRTPSPPAATANQPTPSLRQLVPIARPSSNVPSRRLTVPSIPRRTPVRRPPDCCSSSVTVPPDGWYRYVPVRSCADAPSAPARKSPSVIVELMMNEPALPLPF